MTTGVEPTDHERGLRRELRFWEAIALSIGIMAPGAAMALNGTLPASLVGRAVPLAFVFAPVVAVSRRGLLPLTHTADASPPAVPSLDDCATLDDLPRAARAYVELIERELDVTVELVGTGAAREQVLARS